MTQFSLIFTQYHNHINYLARAGGGGSGSGGSGSSIFIIIGYVPMHALGALLRNHTKKHEAMFVMSQVVGWVIAVAYAVLLVILLRAIGVICAVAALAGMAAGLYGLFGKLSQSKKTKVALQTAEMGDSAWNEESLTTHAKDIFMRYQSDWSSFSTENMKSYMTPEYQYHATLMQYALKLAGRQDLVNNPTISQATVTSLHDDLNNDKDIVVVGISAKANDVLMDTVNNKSIFVDNSQFTEFWQFKRSGSDWLLSGIQQATAYAWMNNAGLESFARSKGYYFSKDWGWLLLPSRGQLFSEGKFGTSDINNHVIGMYNQNLLVQIYNYLPNPRNTKEYLIAQAYLPKNYGDIVVRTKKGLHLFGIKNLKKVSTEWPDFNKRYEVYATSIEQATSLELLNPKYMEQLANAPFEVNIEVVDNVVYLYSPQNNKGTPDQYETMLSLLEAAFKEMKM